MMNGPDNKTIRKMVAEALAEDGAHDDATIELAGIGGRRIVADVIAGQSGVICGVGFAEEAFRQLDESVKLRAYVSDGDKRKEGEAIIHLEGEARAVLAAERVALNFLQRLSGIATLAAAFVEKVSGTGVTILDTRKTTPLWRDLEKYAVRCGGAQNHRRDLRSQILVKENHVRALGGPDALIARLNAVGKAAGRFVEVEVDSLEFLRKLLGAPIDRVMLDNFTPDQVREALKTTAEFGRQHADFELEIEVSGGITLENVAEFAIEGVDFISVGALTHSAPGFTLSLEVL